MSKLARLCLAAGAILTLAVGLLWMPSSVFAAPGEPQDGYGQNGYGQDGYGQDGYGQDGYGRDGHGDRGCPTIHKIALGENLTLIAAKYEVTVEALAEENGLEDANLIVENQSLCIPQRSRGSLSEWASYGVPGHSYDPSMMSNQDGHGPQENGYGPQENGDGPEANGYGPQGEGGDHANMEPGQSYGPYDNQGNHQGEGKSSGSYDVPGKAGQPSHEPARESHGYWKDDLQYPRGGAFFPEYTPSSDEAEPQEPEEPEETPPPTNGENGENGEGGNGVDG